MTTRAEIVAEARTLLGTPYVHQGRRKGRGVDCLGVIVLVGRKYGVLTYDRTDYGRLPNPKRMREELKAHLDEIAVPDARDGDIIHMSWGRDAMHLGIFTPVGLLHAYSLIPAVVEHEIDYVWRSRFRFAYRYRGVV